MKEFGAKKLATITTPEGNALTYTYNGQFTASETQSGAVAGTVSYQYNDDFNLSAVTVGAQTVSYTYDNDGAIAQVGDMLFTYRTDNGFLTRTEQGLVATEQQVNGFGELSAFDALIASDGQRSEGSGRKNYSSGCRIVLPRRIP
ncbi:MAG TPA: hypothetical protein PLV42_00390 [bacterium]|nr:hypothetical protein [bacterium]